MSTKSVYLSLRKSLTACLRMVVVILAILLATSYGWQCSSQRVYSDPTLNDAKQRMEKTVAVLSKDIGVRNYAHYDQLDKTARYIKESFQDLGYVVEEWVYLVGGKEYKNIVARTKNNKTQEYILVGAHYDSCFNPGADDNASGVAGLLELARAFAHVKAERNIMFVAFVNEEPPFFKTDQMGSRVFVQEAKQQNIQIKAAIILEMIGFYSDKMFSQMYLPLLGPFYPNRGDFIAVVGNFPSHHVVEDIQQGYPKQSTVKFKAILSPDFVPGINYSDHASFWEAKIPAVMVTDTAYLRNKNYHSSSDTFDSLDYGRMSVLIEGLKGSIQNMVNASTML